MSTIDPLAVELNEICHRTYATHTIFEHRERILGRRIKVIGYLGVVIPGIIGLVAMGVGSTGTLPSWLFVFASILLGVQFAASLLGTFLRWDELFSQSAKSQEANLMIYREADWAFQNFSNLQDQAETVRKLRSQETELMRTDYRQSVSEHEKRYGERYARYHRKKPCPTCNDVPKSVPEKVEGSCATCGQYKLYKW